MEAPSGAVAKRSLHVLRLCSVFEPPPTAIDGRGARFDPIGGMQEHTGSLTRALDRRGVVQVVLTARVPTAPWVERLTPRATVVRVGLPVARPRQLYSLPAAVLAPLLGRRADLVHVHLGEDLAVLPLARLATLPRQLPMVLTVHCSLAHTIQASDARSALLRRVGGPIERWGERRADATLVYTDGLADQLRRHRGRVAVRVVRRGVDRRLFRSPGPDPFPQIGGRPRVVFVGRLAHQKGIETLVRAAAELQTAGVQVLLVGDGPERALAERLAEELGVARRVHVTGFVEHERVPAVLASADLLVLPSVYEELGTVLLEAMHAGLAVVASRVGGIPTVVEDGVTGLLVPPRDPRALAGAVDTLLGDAALRRRMGENALRRAGAYDLDRVSAEVHGLYAELAGEWAASHAGAPAERFAVSLWPA